MSTKIISPTSALGLSLTDEQRDYFDRHGVLHFPGFLANEQVNGLWKELEAVQTQWLHQDKKIVNGTPIKWGVDVDGSRIVQRFAFANQSSKELADLLKDPRFNALTALVGPEARLGINEKDGLVVNHYVNSTSSKFKRMGWHTDSVRDLFMFRKIMPMLNVGIHFDDQDPTNGGLRIIPGTHDQNVWGMLFKKAVFVSHKPDANEVAFNIKAGDLTVHDGRCWHRVERSRLSGEASRRRVMYIPIIAGKYEPKSVDSPMPMYHYLSRFIG